MYPLQSTGPQDPLILLLLHLFAKQDVAADGSGENPGLLGCICELTMNLYHAFIWQQLS